MAHPFELVLQEGSKGPFSEGACDPQRGLVTLRGGL